MISTQKKDYECGDVFIILTEEDCYWLARSKEQVQARAVGWSCEWLEGTGEISDIGCYYVVNKDSTNVEYAWAHCCVGVLSKHGMHQWDGDGERNGYCVIPQRSVNKFQVLVDEHYRSQEMSIVGLSDCEEDSDFFEECDEGVVKCKLVWTKVRPHFV